MKKKQTEPDFADKLTSVVGTKASLIVHTICFISIFALSFFGVSLDHILLVLTTFLSIEAIYLAIFIQITVNKNTQSLEEVEQDIDEIQENVDEIQEDVDEIQEDVVEIQEDVGEEDQTDREVKETLQTIEKSLQKLQQDLEVLRKKGLM